VSHLRAELVESAEDLEPRLAEWDELAVAAPRPFCAPAWMLAWWRNAAPTGAALRVVLALDGDRLAGVAPFFVQRAGEGFDMYRPLGAGSSHRVGPLARGGLEREAAEAFARTLAAAAPRAAALRLEGVEAGSDWPGLLARAWPGRLRPRLRRDLTLPAPTLELAGGSFDGWLRSKSSNFRQQMRRLRRKLDERGAAVRLASSPEELDRALEAFRRLHHERWSGRGGSSIEPEVERAVADAGRGLLAGGRFRAFTIEADGETISSQLFVAAGGELAYWNGGFDEAWAPYKPAMLTLLAAIEDAFERGERRLDLGGGAHDYKLRLADGDDPLAWITLFPRGARYPLTRLQMLPTHARWSARAVARRLPAGLRARLKRYAPR
jgi:CelD/BcsL family acetyltransferase involved in cellulose biosynthesis